MRLAPHPFGVIPAKAGMTDWRRFNTALALSVFIRVIRGKKPNDQTRHQRRHLRTSHGRRRPAARPARRVPDPAARWPRTGLLLRQRSEEHTSELQSLMRNSYAVFCVKNKNTTN